MVYEVFFSRKYHHLIRISKRLFMMKGRSFMNNSPQFFLSMKHLLINLVQFVFMHICCEEKMVQGKKPKRRIEDENNVVH